MENNSLEEFNQPKWCLYAGAGWFPTACHVFILYFSCAKSAKQTNETFPSHPALSLATAYYKLMFKLRLWKAPKTRHMVNQMVQEDFAATPDIYKVKWMFPPSPIGRLKGITCYSTWLHVIPCDLRRMSQKAFKFWVVQRGEACNFSFPQCNPMYPPEH